MYSCGRSSTIGCGSAADIVATSRGGRVLLVARAYIGRPPYFDFISSPRRIRGNFGAGSGQRLRPAARVTAAILSAGVVDVRRRGIPPGGARDRVLGRVAP